MIVISMYKSVHGTTGCLYELSRALSLVYWKVLFSSTFRWYCYNVEQSFQRKTSTVEINKHSVDSNRAIYEPSNTMTPDPVGEKSPLSQNDVTPESQSRAEEILPERKVRTLGKWCKAGMVIPSEVPSCGLA